MASAAKRRRLDYVGVNVRADVNYRARARLTSCDLVRARAAVIRDVRAEPLLRLHLLEDVAEIVRVLLFDREDLFHHLSRGGVSFVQPPDDLLV